MSRRMVCVLFFLCVYCSMFFARLAPWRVYPCHSARCWASEVSAFLCVIFSRESPIFFHFELVSRTKLASRTAVEYENLLGEEAQKGNQPWIRPNKFS